jgi:hypothetical protein
MEIRIGEQGVGIRKTGTMAPWHEGKKERWE